MICLAFTLVACSSDNSEELAALQEQVSAMQTELAQPSPTTPPSPEAEPTATAPPSAEAESTATAPPQGGSNVIRASVPRGQTTDVTPAEIADLVRGNSEFAFELFRLVAAKRENTVLSPYSIAAALTMTYAGARGTTSEEIRDVLHLGLPDERVHAARNELDLQIITIPDSSPSYTREPFTIRVANSLWGQQGYPFLDEFLVLLAENYDAGMNIVDFVTAAEAARQEINSHVEAETEGRIVDLIPEGGVNGLTRLVLVNAIWFKADWMKQFDLDSTVDGDFTTLEGDQVTVPMMKQEEYFTYADGDGYQAVRLPYYAGNDSMVIVLPAPDRFEEIADGFGPADLTAFRSEGFAHWVDLSMPRFEFRSAVKPKPVLRELGMVAVFANPFEPDGADLTGMTEVRELYVAEVVHQAFIKVDEMGTEASAATAVLGGRGGGGEPPPIATFTVDRPFLFFIEHGDTGEVLFMGQVVDPR